MREHSEVHAKTPSPRTSVLRLAPQTMARKSHRRYSRFGKARPYRVVMRRCCPAPMLIVPDGGRSPVKR